MEIRKKIFDKCKSERKTYSTRDMGCLFLLGKYRMSLAFVTQRII